MMNANTGILMRALSSLPVISSEGTGTSIATNCMNDSIHHFILITGQTTVASNVNPKTAANCTNRGGSIHCITYHNNPDCLVSVLWGIRAVKRVMHQTEQLSNGGADY